MYNLCENMTKGLFYYTIVSRDTREAYNTTKLQKITDKMQSATVKTN